MKRFSNKAFDRAACAHCSRANRTDQYLRETVQHELILERAADVLLRLVRRFDSASPVLPAGLALEIEELHAELVYPQAQFENIYRGMLAAVGQPTHVTRKAAVPS